MPQKMTGTPFQILVWQALTKIPKGKVMTYGSLAKKIRHPRSARAVGNALNKNPYAPTVPCHRVVRSNGEIGGYASGPQAKVKRLKKEGIAVVNGKVAPLKKFLF